jgi:hypothetical protein
MAYGKRRQHATSQHVSGPKKKAGSHVSEEKESKRFFLQKHISV